MAAMSFLESVELAEGFTESATGGSSRSASIHSPRISFSNDFAQLSEDQSKQQQQITSSIHNPSSSGEFEFTMNPPAAAQAPVRNPPMLSADELFYKGKLLPLHLPPRIRMVQDLSEVLSRDRDPGKNPTQGEAGVIGKSPPLGAMRRERSLRSPAKPSVIASTLKSSSYPPPGYSSRPSSPPKSSKCASGSSSSSRWRELFGLKKSISSPKAGAASSSSSVPTKILKMIFNRGGSSSSSASSSGNMNPNSSDFSEIHQPELPGGNEALLPLLRDSPSLSDQHEMTHSSSVSSSASSNWTASSASSSNASSSSFSAEFPENLEQLGKKAESKLGHPRARAPINSTPSRTRRSGAQTTRYQKSSTAPPASQHSGKSTGGNLQRSGSINRRSSAGAGSAGAGVSTGTRMQLQDHVLIGHGNNKIRSENSWRRSGDHKPIGGSGASAGGASNPSNYSSSVRVTPVLHVPACIGPSLRNVRVQGLKRLFSSSSSGSNAPGKPQPVM